MSKDKVSFLNMIAQLKQQLNRDKVDLNNHILLGLEVNDAGDPAVVINSLQTGGYVGLGIIDGLRMMLDEAQKELSSGFIDMIRENNQKHKEEKPFPNTDGIPSEVVKAAAQAAFEKAMISDETDKDILDILDKYKPQIVEALLNQDRELIKELQKKMTEELKERKGPDFNPEFIFGLDDDADFNIRKKEKDEDFDSKNTKKYF